MDFLGVFKMKMKYFYLALTIISIIFIIYVVREKNQLKEDSRTINNPHQNLPNDSIHRKFFENPSPSKANVSEEFRKQLEKLESRYRSNPQEISVATELADLYLASHQEEKAIEIYEKVQVKLSIESLFNLTLAYYNIKNFDKAEEISKLILKKKPNEYRAIFNLGSINATKGNKEAAKKYWNEVIKNYPETEEAKQAKEFLARLK